MFGNPTRSKILPDPRSMLRRHCLRQHFEEFSVKMFVSPIGLLFVNFNNISLSTLILTHILMMVNYICTSSVNLSYCPSIQCCLGSYPMCCWNFPYTIRGYIASSLKKKTTFQNTRFRQLFPDVMLKFKHYVSQDYFQDM